MDLRKKKIKYWLKYLIVILGWFSVSFFGFISGAVIIAFILKHKLGSRTEYWLLNDTEDGDYGGTWWLEKKDLNPSLYSAFLWWLRNPSWNYIEKFKQPSTASKERVCVLYPKGLNDPKNLDKYADLMLWSNHKKSIYGKRIIYYQVGKVFCGRFSYANKWFTLQLGSGGDRFKLLFNLNKTASTILILILLAVAVFFVYG